MNRAALGLSLCCALAATADAQSPLDRRITVRVREVTLREALERVAELAKIRVSYSAEILPLERRVSVARQASVVRDVLDELLRPFPVHAVAVGDDHIVLTPRAAGDSSGGTAAMLARVVVTGSVAAAADRPVAMPLDVIHGRDAERRSESTLSGMLDGAVPGIWMWDQGPSSMVARYGSIRGASSFGLSHPKVYVDGIEVANPLLFTQVTPELVERVEVIRGPQGAALYGSDAISGVVNVVSRHDGTPPDGRRARFRNEMGWATSSFAPAPIAVQEQALSFRVGTNLRSGGFAISRSTTGNYIPNAYSRDLRTVADARLVGAVSTLTFNARAYGKRAGVPENPLVPFENRNRTTSDGRPQALNMYSVGSTYRRAAGDRLVYSVTAGMDGYRLRNISNESTPLPSSADSALRAARGGADRSTLRASVVRQVGDDQRIGATLTLTGEQSALHDRSHSGIWAPASVSNGADLAPSEWIRNTGVSTQANVAIREALYLTAGTRLERISLGGTAPMWEQLPALGVSLVHDFPLLTAKLRGSYGRGVRAPRSGAYGVLNEPGRTRRRSHLAPESQSGIDAGVDLFVARRAELHLTRFDQRASGLIQTVTQSDTVTSAAGAAGAANRLFYEAQNVGEIGNTGWEARAVLNVGFLTLSSAGSFVHSHVRKLADAYRGDLRPGDRMLGVPERTLSTTAEWARRSWRTSWTLTRAANWVNYDRLAIAALPSESLMDSQVVVGEGLRSFWVTYPGATRVRGVFGIDLPGGIGLTLTGDNLTNEQRGEPDTITIVPGKTITLGVTARF